MDNINEVMWNDAIKFHEALKQKVQLDGFFTVEQHQYTDSIWAMFDVKKGVRVRVEVEYGYVDNVFGIKSYTINIDEPYRPMSARFRKGLYTIDDVINKLLKLV